MFTAEEAIKYAETHGSELITLGDEQLPKRPSILYPEWLPPLVCKTVNKHLQILNRQRYHPIPAAQELYIEHINYFNRIKKIFTSLNMRTIWTALNKNSKLLPVKFTIKLLQLEHFFTQASMQKKTTFKKIHKTKKTIKSLKKSLYGVNELILLGMISAADLDLAQNVSKAIRGLIGRIEQDKNKQKTPLKNTKFTARKNPITRKYQSESSFAISFIRSINAFFMKYLKQPLHSKVAQISEVIFNTTYTQNEIQRLIKLVK